LPPQIEIVHHTTPDRLNEDAWLVMQAGPLGDRIVFAAIDGATTRLTPPALQRHLDTLPKKLTPAAFSARLVRDALARHIAEGIFTDLRTLLIEVNADLGRALTRLLPALTLEGMGLPGEVYAPLAHDPRLVRLALPASVITLADYDPATRELRYAHLGDTLLLVADRDGSVQVPTGPDVFTIDGALKRTAIKLRDYDPDLTFRELVKRPEIRKINLHNALHHNYVDEHGLPQPHEGTGVINGLPEMRYFVQTGSLSMDQAIFACAMTDGLEWPASADEIFTEDPNEAARLITQRRAFMAEQIAESGLQGYLRLLRDAETDDSDHERYPRLKTHDDATGVLLRFV
jgi:hypothetical protein